MENVRLNGKLLKMRLALKKAEVEAKMSIMNYLLTTNVINVFVLALAASFAISADAYTTLILIRAGGFEINPITAAIYGDFRFGGVMNYFYGQLQIAQIMLVDVTIYIFVILIGLMEDEKTGDLFKAEVQQRVRKLSEIMKWFLIWTVIIRGFCAFWNFGQVVMI